jgi:bifunctional DNase/RNase
MIIDSLRAGLMNPTMSQRGTPYIVMLKEKNNERYLPIFIGQPEAQVIALKLNNESINRPLTHDLTCSIIETLGCSVNGVVISDLRNDTFYAKILLQTPDGEIELDSRPSDALAIALTWGSRDTVPIYAEESILEKAAIPVDQDNPSPNINIQPGVQDKGTESSPRTKQTKTSPDELGKMSAYTDFLDSLNLDDFGNSDSN